MPAVMIQFTPDTPATGTITTIAQTNFVDGEIFTLDDGINTPTVFEFDVAPDGVTPGNILVDISGDTTADDVRDTIIAAINGVGAALEISAADGGAATVDLTQSIGGTAGNTTSSETVVSAGFILTDMTGGLDDGAFSGPLAKWADQRRKIRWVIQSGLESSPHIAHKAWFGGPQGSYAQPPNSISVVVKYGGPIWFDTPLAFNLLPYQEIRGQIANEVERGILQVLDSTGAPATVADIRGTVVAGTVA